MIDIPYTHIEDDFKEICYFNDGDFNYSIKIGDKCAVTMDKEGKDWIAGVVQDINNNDSFVLNTMNGKHVLIKCEHIYNIYGKEEPLTEEFINRCIKNQIALIQ